MYLTGAVPKEAWRLLDSQTIGFMNSPNISNRIRENWIWAADNGCFNEKTFIGESWWFRWLQRRPRENCLFAVAPDVVADHEATMTRSEPWLPRIREAGYQAAFVAQNGSFPHNIPWDELDVLFIGGDTEWKLGQHAQAVSLHAKNLGKKVHMGRVNSLKRLLHASAMGCDTVDGTYLKYGPSVNTPTLLSWVEHLHSDPHLPLGVM
jgi:hypothetical protein